MSMIYGNSVLICELKSNVLKNKNYLLRTARIYLNSWNNFYRKLKQNIHSFASISADPRLPDFYFGNLSLSQPDPSQEFLTTVPMGPGLYLIHCLVNNKYYIGQSVNASYRLGRHYENLIVGKADCKRLQEDWNKYGFTSFKFIVLVSGPSYSDEKIRLDLEKKLIQLNLNSIYN